MQTHGTPILPALLGCLWAAVVTPAWSQTGASQTQSPTQSQTQSQTPADQTPAAQTPATPPPASSTSPGQASTPRPEDLEPGVNTSSPVASSPDQAAAPAARQANPRDERQAPAKLPPERKSPSSVTTASAPPATRPSTATGKAQDRIELDTTQITGNRELPKVLYIVPWKRSDLGDLVGKPVNSLVDEVLSPIDRDVFTRQNRYYDALKPDATKAGAGAAPGPGPKP